MKRASNRIRRVLVSAFVLTAGCAGHPYEEPGTTGYVLGTIMVIVGIALGVALIFSLNE